MYNPLDQYTEEQPLDIKGIVYPYLRYWVWIVISVVIAVLAAYLYLRYTPNSYTTAAKVKVLTEKEATDLALDLDKILGKGNVNLENERAVLSSFRITEQVVDTLNLQVSYFQEGRVNTSEVFNTPFLLTYKGSEDSISAPLEFKITLTARGYQLRNLIGNQTLDVPTYYFDTPTTAFPFTIVPRDAGTVVPGDNPVYTVFIKSKNAATQSLIKAITISPDGKDSDILVLSIDTTNKLQAQTILNTLIAVYTQDGILDRQEVSKRTISFIDERFTFLTTELDSIEVAKGNYKQSNNLSFFEADAESIIQKRAIKDEQLFEVETQLLLADVLEQSMATVDDFKMMPANIGLNSAAVNDLVGDYNTTVLEYNKWKASAGDSNPKIRVLKQTLQDLNSNIASSLKGYKTQLEQNLQQNRRAQNRAQASFTTLPSKEKILRSIDRQQLLKENLYLLLLQKREEAAINVAVTAANIKVIDYAISNALPVAPKRKIILLAALLLGILVPVGLLYIKFLTNTKIYTSKDVEAINPKSPIIGEIPVITDAKQLLRTDFRNSQTDEAFRTLVHNLNFLQTDKQEGDGHVIAITSSVKGEGKTTVAFNIAQTLFHLKKNVLLIGADLRNPQLHPFIDESKDALGLSNYLSDTNLQWKDIVINQSEGKPHFDIMLSGPIPPMPSVLLSGQRFKDVLAQARLQYDYVIVDTAPTLVVADTLTFSNAVDFTCYVIRSGVTEKALVEYTKKLIDQKKVTHMGYIINAIDEQGSYGYGYNYGYGYGYSADVSKKPWWRFWR